MEIPTTFTKQTQSGFTLIETFVAITILLIAVVGPLSIASYGLNATLIAQDKLTATYLAQEALEYIRAQRDSNFLARTSWLNGLLECTTSFPCRVDVWNPADPFVTCTENPCIETFYYNSDPSFNRYDYVSGNPSVNKPTTFARSVWIEGSGAIDRTVHVRVEWLSGGRSYSVDIKSQITNWAEGLI